MNKKTIIAVAVVILVVLVWWMMASKKATAPAPVSQTPSVPVNTETVYDQQLNGLNEANIGSELQAIDADLNKL